MITETYPKIIKEKRSQLSTVIALGHEFLWYNGADDAAIVSGMSSGGKLRYDETSRQVFRLLTK